MEQASQIDNAGYDDDDHDNDLQEAMGEFRLAFLYIEGCRQRLRKAGDVIEKNRWEWRIEDLRSTSRLSLAMSSMAGLRTVPGGKVNARRGRKKKSVHWADDLAL